MLWPLLWPLLTAPVALAAKPDSANAKRAHEKPGTAAKDAAGDEKSPGPVAWQAERMRMESRAHHVFLDGDVHITRTDLLVLGDKAVADLASPDEVPPEKAPEASRKGRVESVAIPGLGETVQRFTIDGAVHVEHAERIADGDHALYDASAQTLTLEGPAHAGPTLPAGSPLPVLRDAKETLAGATILMRLDSDEIEVAQPQLVLLRSQAPGAEGSGPPVPARADAKTLVVDQDRHLMRFRDSVVLHRADLTVLGPRMDARSGEDGEIDQLEMSGGVQLRQGQRRAVARNAVYDAKERTVVLTGNPKLYDRGDELIGERIEMSLDTDEVRVQRASGRMRPDAHTGEQTVAAKKPGAASDPAGAKPSSSASEMAPAAGAR